MATNTIDYEAAYKAHAAIIAWLHSEDLLASGDYPTLLALHKWHIEYEPAKHEHDKRARSEAGMARLLRDERAKATIPRDMSLSVKPPYGKPADLIIARRPLELGTVKVGDDPRPVRVHMTYRMGWIEPAVRAALEPKIAHWRHDGTIGISRPGTPRHDLDALVRSCGFGPELDMQGRGFLELLFEGVDGTESWTAGLIARYWLTARTKGQSALAGEIQRLAGHRGWHTPEDIVAQRAGSAAGLVQPWPIESLAVIEDQAAQ
jgi:hypothetical protein